MLFIDKYFSETVKNEAQEQKKRTFKYVRSYISL